MLAEEKEVITIGLFGSCDFYDLKGFAEKYTAMSWHK